jgi:Zn-finger nucleic acid-binding protein
MICTNCNCDLTGGYQSAKYLSLCRACEEWEEQGDLDYLLEDNYEPTTPNDLSDDAEALASAGMGTDEDYGYYGDE